MTIEHFWTKHQETMPSSKSKNNRPRQQATDNAATPLAQHGSEHEEEDSEMELEPRLAKALELMTSKLMMAINDKLDPLAKTVLSHTNELKRARDPLDEVEARTLQLETANEPQAARVLALEKKVESLTDHIDELENRGRRKNICIFKMPENMEGRNALDFFERWLPNFLNMDTKGSLVKLERAHRSMAPKPGSDQQPPPVIHAFPDKQKVMAAVRRKAGNGDITLEGRKISFYHDLSAAVLRRRK